MIFHNKAAYSTRTMAASFVSVKLVRDIFSDKSSVCQRITLRYVRARVTLSESMKRSKGRENYISPGNSYHLFFPSSIYIQIGKFVWLVWFWVSLLFEYVDLCATLLPCLGGWHWIPFIWYDFKLNHVMIPFYQFDCKCCIFNYVHFLVWCSRHPTLQGMVTLIS